MSRAGRIVQLLDGMAEVETNGRRAWFNALMVPEARSGDWVLTHTGIVISVIGQTDVDALDALMAEIDQAATEGLTR
ncbi:MAG TPA: HypC/HybG/HupF family hydrogenase formation chaperone [Candidatus Dormibacteraeota bacterium]|nr:HypC/HybG/HupF family hydrogenase formation chaperone [Candidatus Dormibacteraeota bacterium]